MVDNKAWCDTALQSTLSLWRWDKNFARRSSTDTEDDLKEKSNYRPTATFYAIIAMGECGIWTSGLKSYDKKDPPPATEILTALLDTSDLSTSDPPKSWAGYRIDASSHSLTKDRPTFQPALVIGGLFQALRVLLAAGAFKQTTAVDPSLTGEERAKKEEDAQKDREKLATTICEGFAEASARLLQLTDPEPGKSLKDGPPRVISEAQLSEHSEVSTNLLLHLAIALVERKKILDNAARWGLTLDEESDETRRLGEFRQSLTDYFRRQVDRLMARRHVPSDPEYDPTSLAFAIRGLTLLDEEFRVTRLFRAAVEAVVAGQHPDGCWPDGHSVTYHQDGSTIQQPSVEVAVSLAKSVFQNDLLVMYTADQIELLKHALEALDKTASYLTGSHIRLKNGFAGWVSDRTRRPGVSETWITAYAARLFHILFLAERARDRAATLHKYVVRYPKTTDPTAAVPAPPAIAVRSNVIDNGAEQPPTEGALWWRDEMIEPDTVLTPAGTLLKHVIEPLEEQRVRGLPIRRPAKSGVSYIIYGPPGSGKTYIVEQLAEALGWPLLALSPGHFIRRGLELIESTAADIFGDLMTLDHTVVFFDECDELFRERFAQDGEGRNILSFATASMLPKLQELHDARRVIFFLGTNFLSNVDTAIRRPGRFDDKLLLDRPDLAARIQLIKKGWKSKSKYKDPDNEMPGAKSKQAADDSNGWMTKHVLDYGAALCLEHEATDDQKERCRNDVEELKERGQAAVPDYVDWCVRSGKAELEAAGLDDTKKKFWGVFDRWRALPEFKDVFREHSTKAGEVAEAEAEAFGNQLENPELRPPLRRNDS